MGSDFEELSNPHPESSAGLEPSPGDLPIRHADLDIEAGSFSGQPADHSFHSVTDMHGLPAGLDGHPQPWMEDCEISLLEKHLQPHWSVVEYGSGGSTIWMAHKVFRLQSIEHSSKWASVVNTTLSHYGIRNVSISVIPIKQRAVFRGPYPEGYLNAFRSYADFIMELPQPDAVLVDGRARLACMRRALQCLRPGGVLFLHDFGSCGRERYNEILNEAELCELAGTLAVMRPRLSDLKLLQNIQ